MKHYYEATFILDIQGREEGIEEIIDELRKGIESFEGEVYAIQRMERRQFERAAQKLDAGYFLGINFEMDSLKLKDFRESLVLDKKVFRQFYLTKPNPAEANA